MTPTPLPLLPLTPEAFAPFGAVIAPEEDGLPFRVGDAPLDLSRGTPRFYGMKLHARGRVFRHITRHAKVTQCLGAMMGESWMLGVAPPDPGRAAPDPATIRAFLIPGDRAVMLHAGTWHAGPYFDAPEVSFYNLELADTNVVDHDTCDLSTLGVVYEFGGA